jgi:Mg2+ and Co2+ transporter CorA
MKQKKSGYIGCPTRTVLNSRSLFSNITKKIADLIPNIEKQIKEKEQKHHNHPLNDEQLRFLRSLHSVNVRNRDLIRIYGFSHTTLDGYLQYYNRKLITPTILSLGEAEIFKTIIDLGRTVYEEDKIDLFLKGTDYIPDLYISELFL